MSLNFAKRRSARALLYVSILLLVLLPLFFLGLGYVYEHWIVGKVRQDLEVLAQDLAPIVDETNLVEVGKRSRVLLFLVAKDGHVQKASPAINEVLEISFIGGLAERLIGGLWSSAKGENIEALEESLGAISLRQEVRQAFMGKRSFGVQISPSGYAVMVHLAVPLPSGDVLYLGRGSKRGLRQLLLLRHEVLKFLLYQSIFGLLLGASLSRHLVSPLENLAQSAKRYPQVPLSDPQILKRRDELGELARAIHGLAADLESRRQATADLGADVAHEFKNPLATIAASVELLSVGALPTQERVALVVDHINEAVGRLKRSLDALLSLLRLEAILKSEPRESLVYGELVEEILADYQRDPRYADYSMRVECAANVGVVQVVPHRWEELLRNLLDNALQQPALDKEVVVKIERAADHVVTQVCDRGPGVSPGNRDKIFRRFFTQRPPGAPQGTGLGLSIVRAIAEAHGGSVVVADTTDGPGAIFVVTLPLR